MILLVKYIGIPGGLIKGNSKTFEIIDKSLNMDVPVQEMLKRHNFDVLFGVRMMQSLSHNGFFYLTGGTRSYKIPPLVLVNNNNEFFKCLK